MGPYHKSYGKPPKELKKGTGFTILFVKKIPGAVMDGTDLKGTRVEVGKLGKRMCISSEQRGW